MIINFTRNLENNQYDIETFYLANKIKSDMGKTCKIVCDGANCKIEFKIDLSSGEQTTLNTIIENSRGKVTPSIIPTVDITGKIWNSITSQEQGQRLNSVLAGNPFFTLHLDSANYIEARNIMQQNLDAGNIIQEDYDLIDSAIPPNEAI